MVLTLGPGIGANAAVFTIVNRLLLNPLPVRDAAGPHVLGVRHEGNESPHNVSWLDYADYRDRSGAFEQLAADEVGFVGLSTDNHAERITVSYVTGNYFSMLDVPPALGRVLQPGDPVEPGVSPLVVLGHTYWKKRFNSDPSPSERRKSGSAWRSARTAPPSCDSSSAAACCSSAWASAWGSPSR